MHRNRSNNVIKTADSRNKFDGSSHVGGKEDCNTSSSHSNTRYFKQNQISGEMRELTRKDLKKMLETSSESSSVSSNSYNCEHKPKEKDNSVKNTLKMFLTKEIDPINIDESWLDGCPLNAGWETAKTLHFMVKDPVANRQVDRLKSHLQDFIKVAEFGYKIHILDYLCPVLDFLCENMSAEYKLRGEFILLLRIMNKPIFMNVASDIVTYFEALQNYINYMGYLLMRLEDDSNFDLVSQALVWHLSAPDSKRATGTVKLSHTLVAAIDLCETVVRMIALATMHRFPVYIKIALLLACDDVNNCKSMLRENVLECLFYRFNPYFPEKELPVYDINPANAEDINVKLGASSINLSITLTLLLVLLKTTKQISDQDAKFCSILPCPDAYSQRCFAWAYRYECRTREHRHERIMLTIIANCLFYCFGDRLTTLCEVLMADILSLSVRTEVPLREDWIGSVNFNTTAIDVQFKKVLLHLSVDLVKKFPHNGLCGSIKLHRITEPVETLSFHQLEKIVIDRKIRHGRTLPEFRVCSLTSSLLIGTLTSMMESRGWLLGVMYLLDPALCKLRPRWSPQLYADLRKTGFKALVCTLPIAPVHLVQNYGLVRRLMWYIEWYSVSPYELSLLYWCLRVLQVAIGRRQTPMRQIMLKDLFDSHGIIIIIGLCHKLLDQKSPPIEKSQMIISLCLRLITSAVEVKTSVNCCVYPEIKWPPSVYILARRMLDIVLVSLQKHFIISDRWLISLLNFIWEAVIWNDKFRGQFVTENGVFKLLDIITLTRPPVQCLALALVCDVVRAGDAVGQMVTWRAGSAASEIVPRLVKRGATIASLLAAIFRNECHAMEVNLNDNGVIQNLDDPLTSLNLKEHMSEDHFRYYISKRTPICLLAADLAGSRQSKVYAILHMLSKDLAFKVSLADEAYNLYKNIKLPPQDETILILAEHYLTLKLNATWYEMHLQLLDLLPQDDEMLKEFLQIVKGWSKEIKRMQEEVIKRYEKENYEAERSLYDFLSHVRLNIALDALREVRCRARSSDRFQITHSLLHDAVMAEKRRSELSEKLQLPILKTYTSTLDTQKIMTRQASRMPDSKRHGRPKQHTALCSSPRDLRSYIFLPSNNADNIGLQIGI